MKTALLAGSVVLNIALVIAIAASHKPKGKAALPDLMSQIQYQQRILSQCDGDGSGRSTAILRRNIANAGTVLDVLSDASAGSIGKGTNLLGGTFEYIGSSSGPASYSAGKHGLYVLLWEDAGKIRGFTTGTGTDATVLHLGCSSRELSGRHEGETIEWTSERSGLHYGGKDIPYRNTDHVTAKINGRTLVGTFESTWVVGDKPPDKTWGVLNLELQNGTRE